ncbi:hypothetical protein LOTGIDRAFT_175973 [Lottia gigantea]|uniref:Uncharacterized protein n=1 Tax=Lottia gigantea TaxID=225164 RepID=V3ZRD6_LOTGI|nr:hypothetical protein LOTGIDRAFT_175973 [Lottia gigantea]ESO86892.1 hypothetical protein LOTGIDRAFT_175973 [Lottia gigantea]
MENLQQENMFEIRRPKKARRNLSQQMRKNMMEVDMTSSPLCYNKNKMVQVRNEEIKEEINERQEDERIKSAVERLSDDVELISDCSRPYSLPTVYGKHKDLKLLKIY